MKTATVLSALYTATAVSAVFLPEELQDGLYEWSAPTAKEKRDGASGWSFMGNLHETTEPGDISTPSSAGITRRDMFPDEKELECYTRSEFSPSDYRRAADLFKKECDGGFEIKKKGILLWNVGSSFVFACNYWDNQKAPCSTGEIDAAMARIEGKCPHITNPVGWFRTSKWNKSYGRNNGGNQEICPSLTIDESGGGSEGGDEDDDDDDHPHDEVR